ncbi:MAG: MBL fold metallo-hydrolase [Candidatus Micrarchaeota archaeon]
MKLFFAGTGGGYSKHRRTPCVLFETPKTVFMFDAGSGIDSLPKGFNGEKKIVLMLTHAHLDHLTGLFALAIMIKPEDLTIFCHKASIEELTKSSMMAPLHTRFYEKVTFVNVEPSENYKNEDEGYVIKTQKLDHPGITIGYRLEVFGANVAYCTDTSVCEGSEKLARDATVLIHDTHYLEKDFKPEAKHSTAKQAGEMAKKAGVKNFFCFHYQPEYKEEELKEMLTEAKSAFGENAFLSTDGLKVEL